MITDNNETKEIYINPHAKGSYKSWWQPTDDGVIAPDGCEVKYIHHKEHEALLARLEFWEGSKQGQEIAALQQQLDALRGAHPDEDKLSLNGECGVSKRRKGVVDHVLVPMEPTDAMQEAGFDIFPIDCPTPFPDGSTARKAIYQAMIKAAPLNHSSDVGK